MRHIRHIFVCSRTTAFVSRSVFLLVLALGLLLSCSSKEPPVNDEDLKRPDEEVIRRFMIERGRQLVELGGCGECHTPKYNSGFGLKDIPGRYLSGYPQDEPLPDLPYAEYGAGGIENVFYTTDGTIWIGKWGVSFAANITPDPETGIGNWTEDNFKNTFRTGTHIGVGRTLSPPMPIDVYSKLTSEDIRAIFLYLQTVEPVNNKVPQPILPDDELFTDG